MCIFYNFVTFYGNKCVGGWYLKITLNLAIPINDDPTGKKSIKERLREKTPNLAQKIKVKDKDIETLDLIYSMLKKLRKYSVTLNDGLINNEFPIATIHVCNHEQGGTFTDWEDIPSEE